MSDSGQNTIFISRAGADKEIAIRIAAIVRATGYRTIIQDENFGHTSFMANMHDALASGARVISILTEAYLANDNCASEWQAALTGDPLNRKQRLIVFRVGDCAPNGLLKPIPYVNLVGALSEPVKLSGLVQNAIGLITSKMVVAHTTLIENEIIWEVPSFTGREDVLSKLHDALFKMNGVAAVTQSTAVFGMGGVGKSAIAREYAWRNRRDYSILWWLNSEKEDGIIDGLIRLGSHFIPDIEKEADRASAARVVRERVFSGLDKPALLIFDNLEDRAFLRKWKPVANCHVLATSRVHGWGGNVTIVEVEEWPLDDAIDYLLRESGRSDLKQEQAEKIARSVGCLPLALAHAAAFLRDSPATSAASYLERLEHHMGNVAEGIDYPKSVFATFQEALVRAETRGPGAAAVLCLAAFFAPDDIPFELFERQTKDGPDLAPPFDIEPPAKSLLSAIGSVETRELAFSALASLSLIALKLEARSFSVHRLVQSACRELVKASIAQWVRMAVLIANEVYPAMEFKNWQTCARLTPHVETLASFAPDTLGAPLARILVQTDCYLGERAEYERAEPFSRRAVAIDEACFGPDHPEVAIDLGNLAELLIETNRTSEAEPLIRRALAINEKSFGPDDPRVAVMLNNLGRLLRVTQRYDEAELCYLRALEIDEKSGGSEHPKVAIRLNNLAVLASVRGRMDEAEPMLRRALAIDEKSAEPFNPRIALRLANLSIQLWDQGQSIEAAQLMERAVLIRQASLGSEHPETKMSEGALAEMRNVLDRQGVELDSKR